MPAGAAGLSSPSPCAGLQARSQRLSGAGWEVWGRDGTREGRRAPLHGGQGEVRVAFPASWSPFPAAASPARLSPFDKIVFF